MQVFRSISSTLRSSCGRSTCASDSWSALSIQRNAGQPLNACLPSSWALRGIASSTSRSSSMQQQFEQAKERLGKLKEDPGNETKLKMYALFKQGTTGKVNTKQPGMLDFVGRAKWDAWNSLGDMTQEKAMKAYVDLIDGLVGAEQSASEAQASSGQKYENLLVTCEGGLRTITLNRPSKYNALTGKMYLEWVAALEEAAEDPGTTITAVTGAGSYFCSGNDLSNFATIPPEGPAKLAKDSKELLYKFVNAFIEFPKPLVAVVNGPAIGVSVTTLALYDAVYASDRATFQTPFTQLGQSAEGCSSYMFPKIMGPGLASEMLIFNKKITAAEAKQGRLVAEVFPDDRLQAEVWPKLQQLAKLPKLSLVYGKELVRNLEKDVLIQANKAECERLEERWLSDDCMNAIAAFFKRKN